jgi:hypothetical protein
LRAWVAAIKTTELVHKAIFRISIVKIAVRLAHPLFVELLGLPGTGDGDTLKEDSLEKELVGWALKDAVLIKQAPPLISSTDIRNVIQIRVFSKLLAQRIQKI